MIVSMQILKELNITHKPLYTRKLFESSKFSFEIWHPLIRMGEVRLFRVETWRGLFWKYQ